MRFGRVVACLLLACIAVAGAARGAEEPPGLASGKTYRGIAVVAPSIGHAIPAEEIESFVRECAIDVVVVDVGWINATWPKTDVRAVEDLALKLRAGGVVVAAMFHPGLVSPGEARVHVARGAGGVVAADHVELCFAWEDSIEWGVAWGEKVLAALPSVDHVVLQDVRASCVCGKCAGGAGEEHCAKFLRTCRERWTKARPAVRVGHAGAGLEYAKDVQFVLPLVAVRRDDAAKPVDAAKLARETAALRAKAGAAAFVPLVQVTWEAAPGSTTEDVVALLRAMDDHGTGFVLRTYDGLFHDTARRYDVAALARALGGDPAKLARFFESEPKPPPKGDPRQWVWFDSRETPNAPALALIAANGSARTVSPDADTVLISYLADQPRGRFQQLSVSLGDTSRVLVRFRSKPSRCARSELRLKMHLSEVPPTGPIEIAVHAVTEAWAENEACWSAAPAFDAAPSVVASIEPREGEVRIDVTTLVNDWASGARANHGMLVKVARPVAPARPAPPRPR